MSCSCPTALTTGTGQADDRADEPLVGERQQVVEAAAAARDTITSAPRRSSSPIAAAIAARRARSLHVGLGDEHVGRRKPGRDRGQDVALGGGVVAGDEPDQPRDPRQRPLAPRREEALGRELLLQPLERRQVRAEPVALDRQRAQVEVAALLVEARRGRRRGRARRRPGRAGARRTGPRGICTARQAPFSGSLSVKNTDRPALLAAQLGHLALDPDRRQPLEPGRDALVEGTTPRRPCARRLLASTFTGRCVTARPRAGSRRLSRATAGEHELDRVVQVGLGVGDPLGELDRIAGLDEHVQAPGHDLLVLRLGDFGGLCHLLRRLFAFLDEPCLRKLERGLLVSRCDFLNAGQLVQRLRALVSASAAISWSERAIPLRGCARSSMTRTHPSAVQLRGTRRPPRPLDGRSPSG